MQPISDHDAALKILTDPAWTVPPVPPAGTGIGWLRATVGRFATGREHARRRALAVDIIEAIPRTPAGGEHPVAVLARAMGIEEPAVVGLVRDAAQAYQPGTGDESRADTAVEALVATLGGAHDEPTAARIGVLVQACEATAALIDRLRGGTLDEVLRDAPPVPYTKRLSPSGEVVLVGLAGDLAFGAGPRRCPGRAHALALADQDQA